MRISRKKKKPILNKRYYYNEGIKYPVVLVLDNEGKGLGEMKTAEAIRLAEEQESDLVLINPKSEPPVCRIMDYGSFKYQKDKEERQKRARQKVIGLKAVRISLRIGRHDLDIRKNQALKFFKQGNKVKIEMVLRGREMQQIPMAFEAMKKFIGEIGQEENIKIDEEPKKQGNKIFATIAKA